MEEIRDRLNSFSSKEEQTYINFRNHKNIWLILSFISWVLLISAQINTIQLKIPFNYIDTLSNGEKYDYPEAIYCNLFPHVVFLTLTLIGFINYLIFTVYFRDEQVYLGLFDKFAKFHFIPLLAISGIYMTNELFLNYRAYNFICLYINTALSLVGIILLIIIYVKTKFNSKWFFALFIKKGTFSSLIMLLWGNIILNIHIFILFYRKRGTSSIYAFILLPIIKGIGAIVFAFIFKDIMVLFINLLYNIKIIQNYYTYHYIYADPNWIGGKTFGFIPLIMLFLTLISLLIIAIKFKQRIYES